jgi:hypothetical protein
MGSIIVALLAITLAVFPISMPQAAASSGHEHAMAVSVEHNHAVVDADHQHVDVLASCDYTAASGCNDHASGPHDGTDPSCCGTGTCHAAETSLPPSLYSPLPSDAPMVMAGDGQVARVVSGRIDRPPRTV